MSDVDRSVRERRLFITEDILTLGAIVKFLAETYTPVGVEVWLTHRNNQLEDRSPSECILSGEGARVLELARSFGGMVATCRDRATINKLRIQPTPHLVHPYGRTHALIAGRST